MRAVITNHGLLQVPLALMLLLQSNAFSDCPLRPQDWKYGRVETGECYVAQLARSHHSALKPEEIKFEVKDKVDGTVKVEFPMRYEAIFYTASLYINENVATQENCSYFGKMDVYINGEKQFHSVQRISTSACKNVENDTKNCDPTCDLMGSVTFKNVYTGCYLAVVEAYSSPDSFYSPVFSAAHFLTTEYEKYPVWKMTPSVGEQGNIDPDSRDYVVTVIIANLTMLFQERLVIDVFLQNYSTCYFDHGGQFDDIATWTLALSDDGKLICQKTTDSSFFQGCDLDGQTVYCKFTNMKTGRYCLGLEPDHPDQCRNSVWTYTGQNFNTCRYIQDIDISGTSWSDIPKAEVPDEKGVSIIATAIVLSALSVLAIYCMIRFHFKSKLEQLLHRQSTLDVRVEYVPAGSTLLPPKVLLLYAQDCEEFMNLMAVFRELLQTVGKCEVLDCFDPECHDIAACPSAWMRSWASRTDTKVVVVASPCAMVHQKAMEKSHSVYHKAPLNYSDLFQMGLHEVMHNKERKYSNTFVVRFDDSDLDYIVHYTRYTLPLGVKELLKDINMHADLENLTDSFILKKLKNVHNNLLDYYKRQPDYVTQILFTMKEIV